MVKVRRNRYLFGTSRFAADLRRKINEKISKTAYPNCNFKTFNTPINDISPVNPSLQEGLTGDMETLRICYFIRSFYFALQLIVYVLTPLTT